MQQPSKRRRSEGEAPPRAPSAGLEPIEALSIVARSGLVFFQWSRDAGLVWVNEAAREWLGFGPFELASRPDVGSRALGPETPAVLRGVADDLAETGRAYASCPVRFLGPGGRDVWFEARLLPVHSPAGDVVGLTGLGFEATGAIEARQAALDAEERYARIFEEAPVPLWICDPETDIVLDANAMACALYGYRRGEMEARSVRQLTHPDDFGRVEAELRRSAGNGRMAILARARQLRKDGAPFAADLAIGTIRLGGRKVRLVLARDLTASEHARDLLAAKRRAIAGASQPMIILDRDRRVQFANAACEQLLDFAPEELVGQDLAELAAAPDWAAEWRRAVAAVSLGGPWSGWMAFKATGGRTVEVETDLEAVEGEERTASHIVVRLEGPGAGESTPAQEAAVFLDLLRSEVEDLLDVAREAFAGNDESKRAAGLNALAAAESQLKLLCDLSLAKGPARMIDSAPRSRDLNDVLDEALRRARVLLGGRGITFTRSSRTTGPIAHGALVREAFVQIFLGLGKGPDDEPARIALRVDPEEHDGRRGSCVTAEAAGAVEAIAALRAGLASAALKGAGATVEASPHEPAGAGRVVYRVRIPYAKEG